MCNFKVEFKSFGYVSVTIGDEMREFAIDEDSDYGYSFRKPVRVKVTVGGDEFEYPAIAVLCENLAFDSRLQDEPLTLSFALIQYKKPEINGDIIPVKFA